MANGRPGESVPDSFDPRVVPELPLRLVRACQQEYDAHLGGGAVLSGVHLRHRLTRDLDLFVHDRVSHRELVRGLPGLAAEAGSALSIVRDGGDFVRYRMDDDFELDVIYDALSDLEPTERFDGVVVESLADLRANKLTCLLSRSEPRDLVDVLFLERAGHDPLQDLEPALAKDAGMDPAVLAWLLASFPLRPMPQMLEDLDEETLRSFREDLATRLKALAKGRGE